MSYKYEIIIYWSDEDGAFVAEVPELPGCAHFRRMRARVDEKRGGRRTASTAGVKARSMAARMTATAAPACGRSCRLRRNRVKERVRHPGPDPSTRPSPVPANRRLGDLFVRGRMRASPRP